MGSRVSRSTSRTSDLIVSTAARRIMERNVPRSVISAKVRLALRCRSTFSEYTRVLRDRKGSPAKKSVSVL